MNIGILTYYGVHNHGAVLQANALKTVLSSMGHAVSFLTFARNYDHISSEQTKKYRVGLSSIPFYAKYLLKKGAGNIFYNLKKNKTLNRYRDAALPRGLRYSDFRGDLAIIGSDEVFSMEIGVNPFFYGHGIRAARVCSYAGCFGPTDSDYIRENGFGGLVSAGLSSMSAVSVRDRNSQTVAREIAGIEATLVCDPVILYGYEKEMCEFVPRKKNYLLVYAYDKNMNESEEIAHIRRYAKKHNLKIYSVGYHHKWCDKNINATPNELLGYIKHARAVVTDTFHGSVMSIICNTPMVVKLRTNANKLAFLLEEYGLSSRVMRDFSDFEAVADTPVDFEAVNATVAERRATSMKFLCEALGV